MEIINKNLEYNIEEVFARLDNIIHIKDINIYEPYYLDAISNEIYYNKQDNSNMYLNIEDLKYLGDDIYLPTDGYLSKEEIINNIDTNKLINEINKRRSVYGVSYYGIRMKYSESEFFIIKKNIEKLIKIFILTLDNEIIKINLSFMT